MNLPFRTIRTSTIIAAVTAALAGPAGANESDRSPIEIQSCAPISATAPEEVYSMGLSTATGVEITFVNRGSLTAREVTFAVGTDRGEVAVNDRGTFTPGAVIRHAFLTGSDVDAQACRVAAARFEGGTADIPQQAARHGNR
jgi:hypothetical protein